MSAGVVGVVVGVVLAWVLVWGLIGAAKRADALRDEQRAEEEWAALLEECGGDPIRAMAVLQDHAPRSYAVGGFDRFEYPLRRGRGA